MPVKAVFKSLLCALCVPQKYITSINIIKNEIGCRDSTMSKTVGMKGTEVLTLGAVGVHTQVHVESGLSRGWTC